MPLYSLNLELSALADNKYQIRALLPSGNTCQAVAVNRFRSHEVDACFEILSRNKHNITPLEESKIIRQFGQKLFNFVIGDHAVIHKTYLHATQSQPDVRLALSLENAGQLEHLPWELLRAPARDFLALSKSISVVRTAHDLDASAPVPVMLPLRVLVIMATRSLEPEWNLLNEATAGIQQKKLLKLDLLHPTNQSSLRLCLLAEDYHAIHYIGSEQSTLADPLSLNDLSGELYPESTIRLLVHTPAPRPTLTATANFHVPAVATLQFPMSRSALTRFIQEFYRALVQGSTADNAVRAARRAIANLYQTGEWAAPVLYVHPQTNGLFRILSNPGAFPKQASAR
jgi:hypothetical protein